MTCQQIQLNLSLYLYGELDFATEEKLEEHLSECAFCQRALAREKTLHTAVNARQTDVPLDLLAECRQGLRNAIAAENAARKQGSFFRPHWPRFWDVSFNRWSAQVALGSFLLFVGFGCGHLIDVHGLPSVLAPMANTASLLGSTSRIRDVEPDGSGQVRIVIDEMNQHEIIGSLDNETIRRLLLEAAKDPVDPGIRADSVDLLKNEAGSDVRDTLLYTVEHDPNAAVRIKALEGLRRFSDEAPTRDALKFVLQHDQSPDVRSEAIDILAPADEKVELSPDLIVTLQDLVRTEQQGDDYARARALQLLREANSPLDVF